MRTQRIHASPCSESDSGPWQPDRSMRYQLSYVITIARKNKTHDKSEKFAGKAHHKRQSGLVAAQIDRQNVHKSTRKNAASHAEYFTYHNEVQQLRKSCSKLRMNHTYCDIFKELLLDSTIFHKHLTPNSKQRRRQQKLSQTFPN